MDEENQSVCVDAPKRGRGRPKGSLNKKTLARRAAEEQTSQESDGAERQQQSPMSVSTKAPPPAFVLDVEFDTPEETVQATEPEPPEAPTPVAAAKRVRQRRTKPSEPETPRSPARRVAIRKPKPPPAKAEPEAYDFLEVLKRGLAMANNTHKAEKVARYDSFFRL